MKSRLLVLLALTVGAAFAVTALSSSAAAGPAPVVRSHTAGLTKAVRLPAVATKESRAVARRAITAIRHLQASAAGTGVVCLGGSSTGSTLKNQTCTIGANSGVCIEVTNDPSATQLCDFTQSSAGKTNLAIALQVIVQRSGGSGTQTGTQTTNVRQMNANKPNLSFVTQILKQSLGKGSDDPDNEVSDQASVEQAGEAAGALPNFAPLVSSLQAIETAQEGEDAVTSDGLGGPVSQAQQSQQTVNVCQGGPLDCHSVTMTSTNLSSVYQSLRQRERVANSTVADQRQNPQPGTCVTSTPGETKNMCAIVDQNATGTGKNASGLVELYRQFQSGAKVTSLTQEQDPAPFSHGLDHDIRQTVVLPSPADTKHEAIATIQLGRQVQRARAVTNLNQFQDPRSAKGPNSFQTGSPADTWFGRQTATQTQTNDGHFSTPADFSNPYASGQEQVLTYQGFSTGTFDVVQTGTQNGDTETQTCTGSGSCQIGIECTSATPGEGEPIPGGCTPFFPGGGDLSRPR